MRPCGVTPVASTIIMPGAPVASAPRCALCQGPTCPSVAMYWHIGETQTRLWNSVSRIFSGAKSALMWRSYLYLSCEFAGSYGGWTGGIVKLWLMLRMGTPLSKAAGGLAIVIALLSAVFVIAAQCHSNQSSPVVASSHHHDGAAHALTSTGALAESVESGAMNSSLMGELCAGVFFLVLILGRKFLLKIFAVKSRLPVLSFRSFGGFSPGVARLRSALTLPQLGICRI
jgi:hypothetical protein